MTLAPITHRLVLPEGEDPRRTREVLEGRYELPRVPDMVQAHRVLDIGAGVGAFAAWSFYLWPHAWVDCYERNETRAAYCKQNAPPGTKVHVTNVGAEAIESLPRAQCIRLAGDVHLSALLFYPHWDAVRVFVHEWRDESARECAEAQLPRWGFRLVSSGVDHLEHGFSVWMRTDARYDAASDTHFVLGDEICREPDVVEPRFALGLAHAPWIEERRASFGKLLAALGFEAGTIAVVQDGGFGIHPLAEMRVFRDREPNHVWSGKMWSWAADVSEATHALFIQDDVWPAPNFWAAITAMVKSAPHEIIGLEAVHPAGRALAALGERWYATRAWLIGPAYVFPRAELQAFLRWRAQQPRLRIVSTSEDMLINEFCSATGRRVLHPIPTIVDHDTTLASTYGNHDHTHRRPTVKWTDAKRFGFALNDLEDPAFWTAGRVTHLEVPKESQ